MHGRRRRSPDIAARAGPPRGRLADALEALHKHLMSERLAAVETLAAGLAHAIINPLTYTLINVEHVLRRMRAFLGGGASRESLEELFASLPSFVDSLAETLSGMQQVREVVRSLMTFSRGGVESSTLVDVRSVAESSIQMAIHEILPRARLVRELADVSPVMGSEARLGQVFLNLIVNAAHAIPDGDAHGNEVRVSTYMDDSNVVFEVCDTGSGIPPEILPRIFDPFFTSRNPGGTTGLGLSICYGTVKRLGGEILVTSQPERGTCFRVVLPPAKGWPTKGLAAPRRRDSAAKARVLVLDPDPLVGEGLARALADLAEVTILTDGATVLDRLAHGERWDTILCDAAMPDMSGIDLYRETLRIAPDAASRIVFMTAGAFTPHEQAFLDNVGNACLEKPFDVAKVRTLISHAARG